MRHNKTVISTASSTLVNSMPWHAHSAADALAILSSRAEGLSNDEARRRLAVYGPNALPEPPTLSALSRFVGQFRNVLIYVLLGAAAVTALLGHPVDTAVILLVVLANATIGFIQEGRAERALQAIRAMVTAQASVLRDGHRQMVPAADVVPGDLVLLEPGARVLADLRLVRCRSLSVEEAILTGESIPSDKAADEVPVAAPLGDRHSVAFSGTLVTAGHGAGVVVATGAATEIGKVSGLLGTVEPLATPLIRQMDQFARQLTSVILVASALVFLIAVLLHATPWDETFMAVVGIAVAAIPEGLPAVMTITLAIGVQRMAARNAIIRRLPAVETLGSVSVICSDKTGTLTRNEMMVQTVTTADHQFDITGSGYAPEGEIRLRARDPSAADRLVLTELVRAAALCNDASLRHQESTWIVDGDPMEGALISLARKAGLDRSALEQDEVRIDEIPFDAAHRYMATLHQHRSGTGTIYVKGAPEQVLEMCRTVLIAGGERPIDLDRWSQLISDAADQGLRVLALAMRTVANPPAARLTPEDLRGELVLLGFVGLIDPPREEARAAIRECRSAGIEIKMITGDHAATAGAIARQLGLPASRDRIVTGAMLDGMDEQEFRHTVNEATVFARTSPEHKLRIVQALQAGGAVIAMTGDGVNDAPSLKQADVGVAMGRKGTEAAKEASEMILADDNFASIVAAVREGRTVYDNLKKVITWTLPTNGGEALAVVAAVVFGLTLPMTPVQILWINMITAATLGLTLAFEPPEPDVMRRPPRKTNEPILTNFLVWRIALVSLLFVGGAFGMFTWAIHRGLSVEEARTIVVNTIVVMEIFYLFSVRYLHSTSVTWQGVLGTPAVLIGIGVVVLAQLAFTYLPWMQAIFQSRPVSLLDALAIFGAGGLLLLILEIEKRGWTKRRTGVPHAA
jgi:magnesium-transporting ATPase (P-type)